MKRAVPVRSSLPLAFAATLLAACGGTVTSVGSVEPDAGGDATVALDGAPTLDAADAIAHPDSGEHDAESDGPCDCTGLACGRIACGGHQCGTCSGSTCSGGVCVAHCEAGTPCVDEISGEHVCAGDRGAHACTGGAQGFRVCVCDGSGASGWTACGACQ